MVDSDEQREYASVQSFDNVARLGTRCVHVVA